MKKILSTALALLLIISCTACGSKDNGTTQQDNSGRTDVKYGLTSDIARLTPSTPPTRSARFFIASSTIR